jgi:dihydroneopterin aldolase
LILLELHGLELFGYHGVLEHEQREGQLFLYDVELEVDDGALSDRIDDALDYRLVVDAVREVSHRRFDLIEALAGAVADELLERFGVARVKVRVRKRPAGMAVEYSAATVERP